MKYKTQKDLLQAITLLVSENLNLLIPERPWLNERIRIYADGGMQVFLKTTVDPDGFMEDGGDDDWKYISYRNDRRSQR